MRSSDRRDSARYAVEIELQNHAMNGSTHQKKHIILEAPSGGTHDVLTGCEGGPLDCIIVNPVRLGGVCLLHVRGVADDYGRIHPELLISIVCATFSGAG